MSWQWHSTCYVPFILSLCYGSSQIRVDDTSLKKWILLVSGFLGNQNVLISTSIFCLTIHGRQGEGRGVAMCRLLTDPPINLTVQLD